MSTHLVQHQQKFDFAGIGLLLGLLLIVLLFDLTPGLLAGLAAYSAVKWLCGNSPIKKFAGISRISPSVLSAGLVIVMPFVLLTLLGVEIGRFTADMFRNLSELKAHIISVLASWSSQLPDPFKGLLPSDAGALKQAFAGLFQDHGFRLAGLGKTWAGGLLFVIVGVVIGALLAVAAAKELPGPLSVAMQARAKFLHYAFTKVVVAQIWIATVNTVFTALLLFVAFPLFDVSVPYSFWLVVLTFVAGLIPIVGNLLCNVVLTVAGLGVGPHIAAVCLLFLIAVHKFEYFINAKVMGSQIKTASWELLLVMFTFEAVFGVAGLVVAPLYYAYIKLELEKLKWL